MLGDETEAPKVEGLRSLTIAITAAYLKGGDPSSNIHHGGDPLNQCSHESVLQVHRFVLLVSKASK